MSPISHLTRPLKRNCRMRAGDLAPPKTDDVYDLGLASAGPLEVKMQVLTWIRCLAREVRKAVDSDNARLVKNIPLIQRSVELWLMLPGPGSAFGTVFNLVLFPAAFNKWLVSARRESMIWELSGCKAWDVWATNVVTTAENSAAWLTFKELWRAVCKGLTKTIRPSCHNSIYFLATVLTRSPSVGVSRVWRVW